MKLFAEAMAAAIKDGKVKWPLDCGCKSEHYHAKCETHQAEQREDDGRRMGIADLSYSAEMFWSDQGRDQIIQEIKKSLTARPTKKLIIHLRPEAK